MINSQSFYFADNADNYIINYRILVLVEDFIDGSELHVSLWGNGILNMLPPVEMEFSSFRINRIGFACMNLSLFRIPDNTRILRRYYLQRSLRMSSVM